MTSTTNKEPTLADVIEKLDKLSTDVTQLSNRVDRLSNDSEKFNDRFSNYQQATQWVVQIVIGFHSAFKRKFTRYAVGQSGRSISFNPTNQDRSGVEIVLGFVPQPNLQDRDRTVLS